jgi:hypothetical protein
MKRLILLMIMLIGLITDPLSATIYYVATTGSDSNPGSAGSPWRTMQKAANTMIAGDTAIVRDGTYTEGQIVFDTNGTVNARITLQAENRHQAILATTSGCNPSLNLLADYIAIDGLRLTVSPSNVKCGTFTASNYHVQLWPPSGARISVSTATAAKGGWVKNLKIDNSNGHKIGSIRVSQDDAIVEDNEVHGEVMTIDTNNVIFRNNIISSATFGINAKGGARNTQAYNNVVHIVGGSFATGIMAGGCSCDTCFWDNAAHVEVYNMAVYNNVIINDNGSTKNTGVWFRSASNSAAFNNVIINVKPFTFSRSCASTPPSNANPKLVNNLALAIAGGTSYSMGSVTDFSGTLTLDYNGIRGYSNTHLQAHPISGDPLFVNNASDWHLQAVSPAIGKGTVVTLTAYPSGTLSVRQTRDGVTRPAESAWDLGIYQTGGVAGDTAPPITPVDLRIQQ